MAEAYIVDALRTAGGRRNGALRDWHPADMGAAVIDALLAKSGIDPAAVDDVIVGCVSQVGEQSFHVGRNMVHRGADRQRARVEGARPSRSMRFSGARSNGPACPISTRTASATCWSATR